MLNYLLFILVIFLFYFPAHSQKKTFNGEIKMAIKVTSNCSGISDEEWKESFLYNDTCTHFHAGFKYKELFNEYTYYSLFDSKKDYTVFKNVDSLYQGWYNNNILNEDMIISRISIDTLVHGYKCYKLIISSENSISEFTLLDSTIYDNGNYVYLDYVHKTPFYTVLSKAINIDEKLINSQIFDIPVLPISPLKNASIYYSIYKVGEFTGGASGWSNYINGNAKMNLANKYIKIPDGQTTAMQSVKIIFALDSNGKVVKSIVTNCSGTHPKLIKEALRLINNSPNWINATYHNRSIPFLFSQKISFAITKE